MQPNPQPSRDAGGRPIGLILKVALVLSLLAMAVSIAKFAARKHAPAPDQTATSQVVPSPAEPARPKQSALTRAIVRQVQASPLFASQPARDVWPPGQSPPGYYAFVGSSSSNADYLIAGRVPELRTGWDGLLACVDHPAFYKIPPQYYDELRADLEQIAKATNVLRQSEVEFRTLLAEVEKDRQDYRQHARAADAQRQDEAAGAMKRLLELQALYQERQREFEIESARVKPQLQDAPGVFDQKLMLYERAGARYVEDMKQLEAALYTVQKELYATNQVLRGLARNVEAAGEQSAREAVERLKAFEQRLQERLGEVNKLIRAYNEKLGRYGRPLGTPR